MQFDHTYLQVISFEVVLTLYLCEDIMYLVNCSIELHAYQPIFSIFSMQVIYDINMFGSLIFNMILYSLCYGIIEEHSQ